MNAVMIMAVFVMAVTPRSTGRVKVTCQIYILLLFTHVFSHFRPIR